MSNEGDEAQKAEEFALAVALSRRKPVLKPIGHCYNCDEELSAGVFCDRDCEDDWVKRNRNRPLGAGEK